MVMMMIQVIVVIVIAVRAVMMVVMMPTTLMVMVIIGGIRLARRQWVIDRSVGRSVSCPLYPWERTIPPHRGGDRLGMSRKSVLHFMLRRLCPEPDPAAS